MPSLLFFTMLFIMIVVFVRMATHKKRKIKKALAEEFPEEWKKILLSHVPYYKGLEENNRKRFEKRLQVFLAEIRISFVDLPENETLKLLAASSAIIPTFGFKEWEYFNLDEVIIYDDVINRETNDGVLSTTLGQVRPMQAGMVLLLSKQALENGYRITNDMSNVGIHEFSHMIDKADGDIDGVPKAIMPKELLEQYTKLMYEELQKIAANKSDINPYGLTNHAEFFAVVCEYFFDNSDRFEKKHPELYEILAKTFHQRPAEKEML